MSLTGLLCVNSFNGINNVGAAFVRENWMQRERPSKLGQ